jgi:hypothetical protein
MEGTFLGSYEKKIDTLTNLMNEAQTKEEEKKYETELNNYVLQCIPYLEQYLNVNPPIEQTIDPVFNTVRTKGLRRAEIFEDYLRNVENVTHVISRSKTITRHRYKNPIIEICKVCNSSNIFQDDVNADNVCMDCGVCDKYLGEELTYKEEQEMNEKMVVNCGYKKENHLNEWILQFQGRETTTIPEEVIEQLKSEFKKQKIKTVSEISREKVKQILKKLKLTKFYEHSTHITHLLNGLKPPEMSQALEERLRKMFRDIQDPFIKHCPKDRNNFLSYSYVLYKFCELLEEDQYLPFFPLLKSKEKLRHQDVIWKKICKEVQWEYIPTI